MKQHHSPELMMMVAAAASELGLSPRGEVSVVHFYHDDDCKIYRGEACSCEPDVVFEQTGSKRKWKVNDALEFEEIH